MPLLPVCCLGVLLTLLQGCATIWKHPTNWAKPGDSTAAEQATLAKIALDENYDSARRVAAVHRLTDQALLAQVALAPSSRVGWIK